MKFTTSHCKLFAWLQTLSTYCYYCPVQSFHAKPRISCGNERRIAVSSRSSILGSLGFSSPITHVYDSSSNFNNVVLHSNIKYQWHQIQIMRKCTEKEEEHSLSNNNDDSKNENEGTDNEAAKSLQQFIKTHCMTICMVPPSRCKTAWEEITKARTELKDPGLYRWPPHVNIVYPFLNVMESSVKEDEYITNETNNKDEEKEEDNRNLMTINEEILTLVKNAVEQCDPFHISIKSMGTFGGKNRGVLYFDPQSFRKSSSSQDSNNLLENTIEPLIELQSSLQEKIPFCNDQTKHGKYTPHMTLSHFPSLDSALDAQKIIEKLWIPIEFYVDEIYILERKGDGGQFKIVATLPLGKQKEIIIHSPPLAFADMPTEEEDWVYEERMKLKERRNGNGSGRRRRGGRKKKERLDRGSSRSVDTPEEIAKKRAERAAKRERLALEIVDLEDALKGTEID